MFTQQNAFTNESHSLEAKFGGTFQEYHVDDIIIKFRLLDSCVINVTSIDSVDALKSRASLVYFVVLIWATWPSN